MEISLEDYNRGKKLIEDGENTSDKVKEWLESFGFPKETADYEYYGKFVDSDRWTNMDELHNQDVFSAIFDWSEERWDKFDEDGKLTAEEQEQVKEYVIDDFYDNTDTSVIVSAELKCGDKELVVFADSYDGGMSGPERFVMGVFYDTGDAMDALFKDGEMC